MRIKHNDIKYRVWVNYKNEVIGLNRCTKCGGIICLSKKQLRPYCVLCGSVCFYFNKPEKYSIFKHIELYLICG
jgi:hypothetical protein